MGGYYRTTPIPFPPGPKPKRKIPRWARVIGGVGAIVAAYHCFGLKPLLVAGGIDLLAFAAPIALVVWVSRNTDDVHITAPMH